MNEAILVVGLQSLCAFIIGAILMHYLKLSHVLKLDCIFTTLAVIWLFIFPRSFLRLITTQVTYDALHEYLLVNVAATLTVPALVFCLNNDNTDVIMKAAVATSRLVGMAVIVFSTAIMTSLYAANLFGNKLLSLAEIRHSKQHHLLLLDLALSGSVAVVCLVAPSLVALILGQNLDALHAYFYRLVSAMLLGQCCLNKLALHFQKEHCKRTVLMSKAMVSLVIISVTLIRMQDGRLPHGRKFVLLMAGLVVFYLPSVVGSLPQVFSSDRLTLWWRGFRRGGFRAPAGRSPRAQPRTVTSVRLSSSPSRRSRRKSSRTQGTRRSTRSRDRNRR